MSATQLSRRSFADLFRNRKRSDLFRVLGQFVAKALLDSRIIDVSLNRTFLKLIMGKDISRSVETLMVRRFSFVVWPSLN